MYKRQPQFIMMRSMGLYDTLLAMIVLQAFSAFGVFLMRQFYQEMCIRDSVKAFAGDVVDGGFVSGERVAGMDAAFAGEQVVHGFFDVG